MSPARRQIHRKRERSHGAARERRASFFESKPSRRAVPLISTAEGSLLCKNHETLLTDLLLSKSVFAH